MSGIKKKDIEIKLEEIPPIPDPSPELEQYPTPPKVAADVLFDAYLSRDIEGKDIADLGCGTGVLSFGAHWMGASQVKGIDKDGDAIKKARGERENYGTKKKKLEFEQGDIKTVEGKGWDVDTVIMNPPFGAQKKGADIPFLKSALSIASRIYSLHNSKTEEYLRDFIEDNDFQVFGQKRYMFELDKVFDFHTEEKKEIKVTLFAIEEKDY